MDNDNVAILVMLFWYGLSVAFYAFVFLKRVGNTSWRVQATPSLEATKRPPLAIRLLVIGLGLVGVFGLALTLGIYNDKVQYINQSMIIGILVGIVIAKLLTA